MELNSKVLKCRFNVYMFVGLRMQWCWQAVRMAR